MGLNNYDGPYEVEFIPLEVIPSSVASRIGAVNAVNEVLGRAVCEAALEAVRTVTDSSISSYQKETYNP